VIVGESAVRHGARGTTFVLGDTDAEVQERAREVRHRTGEGRARDHVPTQRQTFVGGPATVAG